MSNGIWVRWKDPGTGKWLSDKVDGLHNDSQITDLRKAFVTQQLPPDMRQPARVEVREEENGEELPASTLLTNYFVPPSNSANSAAASGPGKSLQTALFLVVPFQQQPQGFHQGNEQSWYLVTGTIERNRATAGSRHALFRLASGGYYPKGMEPTAAFAVDEHPTETTKRLLSISVVFSNMHSANAFIVDVDKYIVSTQGVDYYNGIKFSTKQVEPNKDRHRLVLESDYIPNQTDGEAPQDSPVWDVEVSSMDISALSPTTVYSRSDTVFKYQRIETDQAFARTDPEGAHIFPRVKCKGVYEWLDKATFNRLALSRDGHKNFDGTANGRGVHAATSALVALEPSATSNIQLDHAAVTRISNRLWCRSKSVANSWRPFLKKGLRTGQDGEHEYYEPIYIYCESNRTVVLKFEQQQESDGTFEDVCVTAIPGVHDPRTLTTWNDQECTVAVSEVMVCLLRWNYAETRRIWAETP